MKYMKILVLAAIAAMALMAFAAGTASATTLSSGSTTLPAGTELLSTLSGGTSAELTDTSGNPLDSCTESSVSGQTEQTSAATISGAAKVTWGGCTSETKTIKGGTLTITWTSGLNGTVTSDGAEVTINGLFGTSCVYGTASTGTHLGTLIGVTSGDATLSINAVVERKVSNFLCPSTGIWKADYKITHGVYSGKTYTSVAVTN